MHRISTAIAVSASVLLGATASAHVPSECAGRAVHALAKVELYSDNIARIQGLSVEEVSIHLPDIQRALQLSIDSVEAAGAVIECALEPTTDAPVADLAPTVEVSAGSPAGQDDWQTVLGEALAFADEYAVTLRIQDRCAAAYSKAYNGRSFAQPFLETVTEWARAKQSGGYADTLEAIMLSSMSQAESLHSYMQREGIADRDRYTFAREYEEKCRADGIRALASQ